MNRPNRERGHGDVVGDRCWRAWRNGVGQKKNRRRVARHATVHVIDRFRECLSSMKGLTLAGLSILEGELTGQDVASIWERMGVPGQRGVRGDGEFDHRQLRGAAWVMGVGHSIPGVVRHSKAG